MSPKADNRKPWTYVNPHMKHNDPVDLERCRTPNIARDMSDPGLRTTFYGNWNRGAAPDSLLDRFPYLADESSPMREVKTAYASLRSTSTPDFRAEGGL
jgi:hypothetical protein